MTGATAPGFTSLAKHLSELGHKVYTSDYKTSLAAQYIAEEVFITPSVTVNSNQIEFMKYTKAMEFIVRENEIDIIMPIRTADVMALVSARYMEKAKLFVPTMNLATLTKLNNKYDLMNTARMIGMTNCSPVTELFGNLEEYEEALLSFKELDGYIGKVVVKPTVQSGSRGMRIINVDAPFDEFEMFINTKPSEFIEMSDVGFKRMIAYEEFDNMLMQEYLVGQEYTVDCLAMEGKLAAMIPRRRDAIIGGISKCAVIETDTEEIDQQMYDMCEAIVREYNLSYHIGFQFKCNMKGDPVLIECNPRLQGSSILSIKAGVDILDMAIRLSMGEKIEYVFKSGITWNMKMERTFQEWFK